MRRLLYLFAVLLLMPPLLAWLLVGTQPGSRWLVQTGAGLLPGLAVDRVHGNLLAGIELEGLHYADPGTGLKVDVERLSAEAAIGELLQGELHLRQFQADGIALQLPPDEGQAADLADLSAYRLVSPVAVQFDALALSNAVVRREQQTWDLQVLTFAGRLDQQGLRIDRLKLDADGATLVALGQVAGDYPYALSLQTDWQASLSGLPEIAGSSTLSGDVSRLVLEQQLTRPYGIQVSGTLLPALDGGAHRFELLLEWSEIALPVGEETLISRQGRLELRGDLASYRFSLNTQLQHDAIGGPVALVARGHGDLKQLSVDDGRLETLGGRVSFDGGVAWEPALAWQARLQADGIDPARQWPDWPGALKLDARLRGALPDGRPSLQVELASLAGQLRGYPVSGQGRLSLTGDRLDTQQLELRSGNNRLWLNGRLLPSLDLSFTTELRQLDQLAPALAGSLEGEGQLHGSLDALAAKLALQGRGLVVQGMRLAELDLQADIDPADAAHSSWRLKGRALELDGVAIDHLSLDGQGHAGQHRLSLQAAHTEWQLGMQANGGLLDGEWRGEVLVLDLQGRHLGSWTLEQAFALQTDGSRLQLAPLCLAQGASRLCASGQRDTDGRLQASGQVAGLPLAVLQPWLNAETQLEGTLGGDFKAEGMPGQLQADLALSLSEGRLIYRPITGPAIIAEHHDGHLRLAYRDEALQARFGLGLGDDGQLQGELDVRPPQAGQRALQGELTFQLSDPAPLGTLLPQLSDWRGDMNLHALIGGSVEQPTVQVTGGWQGGSVRAADLGITLTEIALALKGDGDRLTLEGEARSGPGRLALRGEAELSPARGWPVRLHLEGEAFEVARRSDLELRVSPALDIQLGLDTVSVSGRVAVPYGRIEVTELPAGTVRVSQDEIIVGAVEQRPEPSRRGAPLKANLQLVLGEDVQLKAYGLDTRLTGELALHQEPGRVAEGYGQLQLVQGRFKAYGQDLVIERGRLVLAGPLTTADVDVRAVRKVDTVTVGILLSGPLQSPTTSLFSLPPMNEADILSYLFTGGPLSTGQEVDATMLTQAAVNLGLDKSTSVTSQLAASFGVDELSITGGKGGLEGSAMAVGKRLSPDLYVRYLYGLFDTSSVIQLRYRLSDRVRLQGEAGQESSVDVIYELERD